MKRIATLSILCGIAVGIANSSYAQPVQLTITVDENGNGSIQTPAATVPLVSLGLIPDPGPGGLGAVLTYQLPFAVLPGDVGLTDALENGLTLDYLRFNPGVGAAQDTSTLAFYSDNLGGADALADTSGPPTAFYQNLVRIPEVGPEGDNGALYTPNEEQPGFVSGLVITYHFISDSPTTAPEAGSTLLSMALGVSGLAGFRRVTVRK